MISSCVDQGIWYDVLLFVAGGCRAYFFFFKQKTAYEMRISDWSSDVCSSDLWAGHWHSSGRGPNGMNGILYKIEMIEPSLSGGSHGNGMNHVLQRKKGGNG